LNFTVFLLLPGLPVVEVDLKLNCQCQTVPVPVGASPDSWVPDTGWQTAMTHVLSTQHTAVIPVNQTRLVIDKPQK
jgi:hypothetical protein